ncbi:MAG: hypothetical protein MJE68_15630, partial [Proteobacteria bacterium]|nr:hypothetical protein [Pseudomonadota bacterium]
LGAYAAGSEEYNDLACRLINNKEKFCPLCTSSVKHNRLECFKTARFELIEEGTSQYAISPTTPCMNCGDRHPDAIPDECVEMLKLHQTCPTCNVHVLVHKAMSFKQCAIQKMDGNEPVVNCSECHKQHNGISAFECKRRSDPCTNCGEIHWKILPTDCRQKNGDLRCGHCGKGHKGRTEDECRKNTLKECKNCQKVHPGKSLEECINDPNLVCLVCGKTHPGKSKDQCSAEKLAKTNIPMECGHYQKEHPEKTSVECITTTPKCTECDKRHDGKTIDECRNELHGKFCSHCRKWHHHSEEECKNLKGDNSKLSNPGEPTAAKRRKIDEETHSLITTKEGTSEPNEAPPAKRQKPSPIP